MPMFSFVKRLLVGALVALSVSQAAFALEGIGHHHDHGDACQRLRMRQAGIVEALVEVRGERDIEAGIDRSDGAAAGPRRTG